MEIIVNFASIKTVFMDRRDFIEKSALAASGALLSATGVEALANDKNGKTMKVLMINGSPHQKGNTAVALDEIAKQLKVNGIDSEIVWIGNKAVRGCIACGGCSRNPGKCVFEDDICNRIHRTNFVEMNVSNGLSVSLALSFGDQAVNSEGILLNLVRNVKAADDVLDITHVSVVMVMFVYHIAYFF